MYESSATVGSCPYCGHNQFQDVQALGDHPNRDVMQCIVCEKFSTRQRGKHFPHDDPYDKDSTIAQRVRA